MVNTITKALKMSTIHDGGHHDTLVGDIRLLGRILGDVIAAQEGSAVFNLIEEVRQLAVSHQRTGHLDAAASLQEKLGALGRDQAVTVVRAFAHYAHLANVAEDLAKVTRLEATQDQPLAQVFARLEAAGLVSHRY
jgi:phosphoenolpyruvate carboxylase